METRAEGLPLALFLYDRLSSRYNHAGLEPPVEVRAALASFAADSPLARLVMVNNGREHETESILHEFAEALDDRALLLSTGRNIGTVAALNLGLVSSRSAPFALVTNPFVRLASGWFDPVMAVFERVSDAGAVSLRSGQGGNCEADHGSFTAMVLKKELLLLLPVLMNRWMALSGRCEILPVKLQRAAINLIRSAAGNSALKRIRNSALSQGANRG